MRKKTIRRFSEWELSRKPIVKPDPSVSAMMIGSGSRDAGINNSSRVVCEGWVATPISARRELADEEWVFQRVRYATLILRECVEVDPDKRDGIPVLRGTRFTLAQMLAQLAEGRSLPEIAKAFRLDENLMRQVLESLAICLDRSAVK